MLVTLRGQIVIVLAKLSNGRVKTARRNLHELFARGEQLPGFIDGFTFQKLSKNFFCRRGGVEELSRLPPRTADSQALNYVAASSCELP
jgi:hypothetical protein